MKMEWSVIGQISSSFALVAFLAAVAGAAYRASLTAKRQQLAQLPPTDRLDAVKAILNSYKIDGSNLTKDQQFQIAMQQLQIRSDTIKLYAISVVIIAVILGAVGVVALLPTPLPSSPDARTQVFQRLGSKPEELAKCLHVLDAETQPTYDGKVYMDLGNFYSENDCIAPDLKKALDYYNRAVTHLEWSALIKLGNMYASGEATGNPDYVKARQYFEQAIQHNEPRAYLLIGQMYYLGQGVAKDVQKAISLDIEGAEHGDPRGYTLAGAAYTDKDSGILTDCEKALSLIQKGYDLGEERAATLLCDYRYHGQCLPQDRTLARSLCEEGKVRGDERATYLLENWGNQ